MAKGVAIGLSQLHYADLLNDDAQTGTYSYAAPVRVTGAISANFSPNASNDTLFADDGPYDTASTLGAMSLELNVADLPPQVRAHLLGETYENGIVKSSSEAIPPYVAVGMSIKKSNGADRLIWYLKGKFTAPDENNQTKADSINWNTPTITANFLKRDADNQYRMAIDTDDENVSAAVKANWFTSQSVALTGETGTLITDIQMSTNTKTISVGAASGNTFTATITPVTANVGVIWASSDESVAKVTGTLTDNSGVSTVTITALKAGTAIISASVGSVRALCSLTVTPAATAIALDETTKSLAVGATTGNTLIATLTPLESGDAIEWTSSDQAVATVSGTATASGKSTGTITAVAAGTATITAKVGSLTATCTLTVTGA